MNWYDKNIANGINTNDIPPVIYPTGEIKIRLKKNKNITSTKPIILFIYKNKKTHNKIIFNTNALINSKPIFILDMVKKKNIIVAVIPTGNVAKYNNGFIINSCI